MPTYCFSSSLVKAASGLSYLTFPYKKIISKIISEHFFSCCVDLKLEKVFYKKHSCGFILFKTVLYTHILNTYFPLTEIMCPKAEIWTPHSEY